MAPNARDRADKRISQITFLANRTAKGDYTAEKELIEYLLPRINWQVARSLGPENQDRKEVVQKSIIEILFVFRNGKFDAKRGTVGSLVWGIVNTVMKSYFKNRSIHHRRMASLDTAENSETFGFASESDLERIGLVVEEFDVEYNYISQEAVAILKKCIHELPPKQRQVVVYKVFHDLKHKTIGAMLNKNEQHSIETFRLARKQLRKCYLSRTAERNKSLRSAPG